MIILAENLIFRLSFDRNFNETRRRDPLSQLFVYFEYQIVPHPLYSRFNDAETRQLYLKRFTLTSGFNFCPLSTSFVVEEGFDVNHDPT